MAEPVGEVVDDQVAGGGRVLVLGRPTLDLATPGDPGLGWTGWDTLPARHW
jgi:hypothetical protein